MFFKSLLPAEAAIAEACDDTPMAALLMSDEVRFIASAVPSRRREFARGRHLARAALAELGLVPVSIGVGASRQPLFPPGIRASITHTHGFCAAAAVRAGPWSSIGIDADAACALDADVADLVLRPEERRMLAGVVGHELPPCADKVVFCAKEAFYKAYFQLEGRYLDFMDACVVLHPGGCFSIEVLKADVGPFFQRRNFDGRYAVTQGRVHAGIAWSGRAST